MSALLPSLQASPIPHHETDGIFKGPYKLPHGDRHPCATPYASDAFQSLSAAE